MKMHELYNATYSDGRGLSGVTLDEIYRQQGETDVTLAPVLRCCTFISGKQFCVEYASGTEHYELGTYESAIAAQEARERYAQMTREEFFSYVRQGGVPL